VFLGLQMISIIVVDAIGQRRAQLRQSDAERTFG
jgi:hypothetical protein